MQMRYTDPVYGQFDLNEPVLIDLMASEAMQRLKGVLQHGISGLIGVTRPISRFEHSLGAMLIGWLIDRWFGTAPAGLLVMLFLGIGAAFTQIIRISKERAE